MTTNNLMLVILFNIFFPTASSATSPSAYYSVTESSNSVRTDSSVVINMACDVVWETFIDVFNWKSWTRSLYVVEPIPINLSVGTELHLIARHRPLNAFPVNIPVTIKITQIVENEFLVWDGKPWGVYGYHGFHLEQQSSEQCLIKQWEQGYGIGAKVGRAVGVFDSMGRIHVNFLNTLKVQVETAE